MHIRATLRGLLLLVPFALGGCDSYGDCGTLDPRMYPLKSAMYGGAGSNDPDVTVRHRVGTAVIDAQAGTATFTFDRAGKEVVEVWKLTKKPMP